MKHTFYILEYLSNGYPKTGYELYLLFRDKADFVYHQCDTRQKLMGVLELINIETYGSGKKPFVHLDCHGNENGIEIISSNGNEESIKWREISSSFRKIYRNSKKRSVLCLSGCCGFNAVKMVAHFDTCPYDYIGGLFEKTEFQLNLNVYKFFYQQVLKGEDTLKAGTRVRSTFESLEFTWLSSSQIFEMALKEYVKVKLTPQEIEKQKKKTIEDTKKIHPVTEDFQRYIDFRYSDTVIAEYIEEWRRVFFS